MSTEISEEEVWEIVGQVKHPMINLSLVELGIVRDVTLEGNKVAFTFASPFPKIPIKDRLIKSVRGPLERMGASVEVNEIVMDQEQLQRFLTLEKENWTGWVRFD